MNIERLIIKNFKNYMGEVAFDLSKEVVLLYGANGFGKSSFFDAIEWCLTGKINRFDGSENELKYDISNKRIDNGESFEVSVTLVFDGNKLIRYFNMTDGTAGNLQVRIITKNGNVHIGQEQIETFLKMHTAESITYERGNFSQLLKQAYILSQDQVTDFITGEDAKERYRALANIMGLKSILIEFDNFKKVLKGLYKNKEKLSEQISVLEKAIIDKSETMHSFDAEKLVGLLEKSGIKTSSEENLNSDIENKIFERLNRKSSLENYIEFYNSMEDKQKSCSVHDLENKLNVYESRKELLFKKEEKAQKLFKRINNKILSLSKLEENLEKVNGLKNELSNLQGSLNRLNIEESKIEDLNQRLELLRSEKVKIEYNLNVINFERKNAPIIKDLRNSIDSIKKRIESIDTRLQKNNRVLEKILGIIDENKDKVLAKLISGIKDIQVYTDKYELNYCPVCSSPKSNLNNDIVNNLSYYLTQLNEESSYYEKVIRLSKYLENREQKLNEDLKRLERKQNVYESEIISFENELANYKSSSLFKEELFLFERNLLEEELANKVQEINKRQEAVELILKIEKGISDISDYEKTSKTSNKIKSQEEVEKSINKNKVRKDFVNLIAKKTAANLTVIENDISSIKFVIFKIENLITKNQYNQNFMEINNMALESIIKIDTEVDELKLIKELLLKQDMNSSIKTQITNITEKQVSLNFKISKLVSYLNLLEKYKEEKQNFIGNGIADFLNRNHSTVQRYFRYLNPIPSNSELIFEGDEEQLNIKVAYNKEFSKRPGGKSNAKNILSSGQLNVLAISIFLAINKEQQIHSLNFVGIDDPIQNMDDVNQYTMCDVLNNIEKQLIISTHDINFLKLFIKKNEYRKNNILVYNLKSPYISSDKLETIEFSS